MGAIHSTKIPTCPTGKVVDLKRRTSFFETFLFGPNGSIEFWTKIPEISVEWIVPYNLGNGSICVYVGVGVRRKHFCERVSLEYTG